MPTNNLRALVRKHLKVNIDTNKHSIKLTKFSPGEKEAITVEVPKVLLDGRVNTSRLLAKSLYSMRISKGGKLSHKLVFYNHTTQGFIFVTGRTVER